MRRSNIETETACCSLVLALSLSVFAGCSAIQSESTRELISRNSEKIAAAKENSAAFQKSTEDAISSWKKGLKDIDRSLAGLKTQESIHRLIFSSNQNVRSKIGVEAHATAYLVGELYLVREGLDEAITRQFYEDFQALTELSQRLTASWEALEKLQSKVQDYSKQTFVAGVDPEFVNALITELSGDMEGIEEVLKRSRQVNDALRKVASAGVLGGRRIERTQTFSSDVIELLEAIKE